MAYGIRTALAVLILACTAPAAAADWGAHPVWDDGLAEVAVYSATRVVYGKPRAYEATLITVKEDFNAAYHAKADPPYEGKTLIPILKLNIVSEIQTAQYPYRYLMSIFVDRTDVTRLVKMTVGSQEWCGNTFKELRTWGSGPELVYHSYWDGEGDGVYALEWDEGTLLEDQLPVSLRALPFEAGLVRRLPILPTQMTNRAPRPEAAEGRIRVTGAEIVETGGGQVPAWRVAVTFGEQRETYWFQKAHPNIMLGFEASDGRSMRLDRWSRRTYW